MKMKATAAAMMLLPATLASAAPAPVQYRTAQVDGLQIFYREAGAVEAPVLVLLHGRQTSSHMFEQLIPLLAERYRVVAPDLPGFGQSSSPPPSEFSYTFDHLAAITRHFLQDLHVSRYGLLMHDWGVPLGFRLASSDPRQISLLVVQNGVICEEPNKERLWLDAFWEGRDPAAEMRLRKSYKVQTTIRYHQVGASDPSRVSPDSWILDQYYLDQPGRQDIQVELMYDFGRSNKTHHARWQQYLSIHRPPTLVLWGKDSPVYSAYHAECFKRANPTAEIHFYAGGHFLLDEYAEDAATRILRFTSVQR